MLWNSSARIEKNDGSDKLITDEFVLKGNVTEQGLIKFFMGILSGQGCIDVRNELTEDRILQVVQFSSKRKKASIVVRNPDQEGTDQEVRVYTKGAPDMLYESLVDVLVDADGNKAGIEDTVSVPTDLLNGDDEGTECTELEILERTVKKFAKQAFRTILVCYRDMSMDEYETLKGDNNGFEKEEDKAALETGLTAVGLFGIQDPLRPTIIESIKSCKKAGIEVIMCTGDNIDTAIAISKNAGILPEPDEDLGFEEEYHPYACMTGKDFRETVGPIKQIPDPTDSDKTIDVVSNMKKFRDVIAHLRVLARSSPEDKYLLVTGIQGCNGVVAVTGDGTNDAPALTKADVGFSMGITGTDVAKGASDIILLDDNFSSIVVALRYGRSVYDNVRKFL